MITTSPNIGVYKVLREGVVTNYTTNNVSLFIKHEGIQKRFSANSVLNSSTTASGLIVFSIPLWTAGNYSFFITVENWNDLDTSGVELVKIATGYVKLIPSVSNITV